MDSAVQDERAPALFQAAADKFQEVSAHGARPPRARAAPALHHAASNHCTLQRALARRRPAPRCAVLARAALHSQHPSFLWGLRSVTRRLP